MLAELKFTIIINNWWVKHTKSVADVATQVYGSWIMSFYSRSREMWLLIATFSVEAYQMSFWLWAWKLPEFWSEISIVSKFEHWTSPWNVWWIGKKYEIILKVSTNESKCLKHPWSRSWSVFKWIFRRLIVRQFVSIFHHLFSSPFPPSSPLDFNSHFLFNSFDNVHLPIAHWYTRKKSWSCLCVSV